LARAGDSTRLARRVLRQLQSQLKPTDPLISRMLHVVAKTEMGKPRGYPYPTGDDDPAIVSLNDAIAAQQKAGADKLQLASMYESLAKRQQENGKGADAVKSYETVVTLRSAAAANDAHLLSRTYDTMADFLRNTQQLPKAEEYKKRSLAIWEKQPGPSDLNLINGLSSMAYFYQSSGQLQKAASYMERRLALQLKRNPRDVGDVESLAKLYMQIKDYSKALPLLEKVVAMRNDGRSTRNPGKLDYDLVQTYEMLGEAETSLGKIAEAEQHLSAVRHYYDHQDRPFAMFGEIYPERFLQVYTQYLQKAGKTAEYATFSARLAALREKTHRACLGCGRG
jgi:tetratricopeptide (TPR) repeat protein